METHHLTGIVKKKLIQLAQVPVRFGSGVWVLLVELIDDRQAGKERLLLDSWIAEVLIRELASPRPFLPNRCSPA